MANFCEANLEEIAEVLKNQRDLGHSTCLLVGAGISVSAGIPDAKGIMSELKRRFPERMKKADHENYFDYMSLIAPGSRRNLIRNYIVRSKLNKSHACLAALVNEGYVDRILTINFDPLIEKTMSLYGVRPVVHDFASSKLFIPGVTASPALLYLHGKSDGFLLLNTEEEVNSLVDKLKPVFEDSNRGRSWIIVGYGGNDKTVFAEIARLENYEYGLYWVGYKNLDPEEHIKEHILVKPNTHFVRMESSDLFFQRIIEKLGIEIRSYSRPKTYLKSHSMDTELTNAGMEEARDVFGVKKGMIRCLAFKILHENTGNSYIHRIYIKEDDFALIKGEFDENNNINIIKALIKRKDLSLSNKKLHQFAPTTIGKDDTVFDLPSAHPAMLHIQVSYVENTENGKKTLKQYSGKRLEPIEFLVSKYVSSLNLMGYMIDKDPKATHEYSMAAEDLYKEKVYSEEVIQDIQRFYLPFSRINMEVAEAREGRFLPLPYSAKPEKLLRIFVVEESHCNYRCVFCCQSKNKNKVLSYKTGFSEYAPDMLKALIHSGCHRIMLTGGEPLLCNREDLLSTVRAISDTSDIEDFWICTNGSKLNKTLCKQLKKNGLGKIVVTIAAETNDKYKKYSDQISFDLDAIINKVKIAVDSNFLVKVDVPLNREGIKNVKEFLILIQRLQTVGVKEVAYFQLHKTPMNKDVFDSLFVEQDLITWELLNDNSWRIVERNNGQKVFYDGQIEIIIPTSKQYETSNCKQNKCGDYCQGIYASYLGFQKDKLVFKGCHRKLVENTITINRKEIKNEGQRKILNIFTRLWNWAYNEDH